MDPILSASDEKMVGLSIKEFESELLALRKEAKQDPSLRKVGEAATGILTLLLSEEIAAR